MRHHVRLPYFILCNNVVQVGMPVSRWALGITWNVSSSPDNAHQFSWRKRLLWRGGFHGTLPHWGTSSPQAPSSDLRKFPSFIPQTLWRQGNTPLLTVFWQDCDHGTNLLPMHYSISPHISLTPARQKWMVADGGRRSSNIREAVPPFSYRTKQN